MLVVANFGDSKSRQRAEDALSRLGQIERGGSKDEYADDAPDTACKETNKKKRRLEGRENKRKNTRNLTRPRSDEAGYVVEEDEG